MRAFDDDHVLQVLTCGATGEPSPRRIAELLRLAAERLGRLGPIQIRDISVALADRPNVESVLTVYYHRR